MTVTIVENPILAMKRFEFKYIIDRDQERYFRKALEGHMQVDRFGLTSIASLYYDTPEYRLITTSIEKPLFKEKMRLRSYGPATATASVSPSCGTRSVRSTAECPRGRKTGSSP